MKENQTLESAADKKQFSSLGHPPFPMEKRRKEEDLSKEPKKKEKLPVEDFTDTLKLIPLALQAVKASRPFYATTSKTIRHSDLVLETKNYKISTRFLFRPEKIISNDPYKRPEHRMIRKVNPKCVINPTTIDTSVALEKFHDAKRIQLVPNQALWLKFKSTEVALLKASQTGAPILYLNPEEEASEHHPRAKFIAASCAQQIVSLEKNKNLGVVISACVNIRNFQTHGKYKTETQNAIRSSGLRFSNPTKVPLMCYCNAPDCTDEAMGLISMSRSHFTENTIKCACKEVMHEECLTVNVKNAFTIQCAACTANVITPGVTWCEAPSINGRQIKSTSPVDNFLTYTTIFEKEQNQHLNELFADDVQSENLITTLRLVKGRKFNAAHMKYYDEMKTLNDRHNTFMQSPVGKQLLKDRKIQKDEKRKRTKDIRKRDEASSPSKDDNEVIPTPIPNLEIDNMWGSLEHRVNAKHLNGFQFKLIVQCDNDKCNLSKEIVETKYYYEMIGVQDVAKIESIVTKGEERICRKCDDGIIRTSPALVGKNTWGFSIHLSGLVPTEQKYEAGKMWQTKADIFNGRIPQKLTFSEGTEFGLAAVVFAHTEKHFTSAIWIPSAGEYVWYDGKDQLKKIRKIHFPTDVADPAKTIKSVEYLRLG